MKIIPTWVWLLAIGIALAIGAAGGWKQGSEHVQNKWDKSVRAGEKIVADLKEKAGKITYKTEYVYRDRIKEIEVKGDTITKLVPKYIPVVGACSNDGMLSGAFRVLHDGAAQNRIPDAAAIADGANVSAQDVAATVTENYAGCNVNAEKLDGWKVWATEQCKLNPKGCPPDGRD
jgi:hypothetical protein